MNLPYHQIIWLTSFILTVFTFNASGIPSDTKQILSLIKDMKVLNGKYSAKLTNLESLIHEKKIIKYDKGLDKYRSDHKQRLKIVSKMPNNESLNTIVVRAKLPNGSKMYYFLQKKFFIFVCRLFVPCEVLLTNWISVTLPPESM